MGRPFAYITRRLPQPALDMVAAACDYDLWDSEDQPVPREVLLQAVTRCDGLLSLVSDRIEAPLLAAAPRLRVVANMAVGYDNVDLAALTARNVLLTNTPDVLTNATADLAWALLLSAARRLPEGQQLIAAGEWRYWAPLFMVGQELSGALLGVVGAGRIGSAVLQRAAGFVMRLCYHNRTPARTVELATGARYLPLDTLLREADFVVVCVPLNAETRGMFGAREFALMKPTSVFVNVARGAVVCEAELVAALRQGRPWAAGLDVFEHEPIGADHPLVGMPNVTLAPHIGSATTTTRLRMATRAARNLVAALTGQPVLNPVNG